MRNEFYFTTKKDAETAEIKAQERSAQAMSVLLALILWIYKIKNNVFII